jgi:hypothetical protein
MATASLVTPLNITGNTTSDQQEMLRKFLSEAVTAASKSAIEKLDRQSAQLVLDKHSRVKAEFTHSVIDIVLRHTISDKYKDEETPSSREYPPTYHARPIEAQVSALRKHFPLLGSCMERLGRRPPPEGAEAWFAIPRWQALAPTYNEAVELVVETLAQQRKFANRVKDRLSAPYLRQAERSDRAQSILSEQQRGNDIQVVAAQLGRLHRGCSARRTRMIMLGNEFGLGAFAFGCILLTHPERLSTGDALMVDCGGDEYSLGADGIFDRVPLFEYDLSGLEFSVFYNDRSRNLWGSPSGFLFQM